MIPANVIARKRDGEELSSDEIAQFVSKHVTGEIPDYQMAALAMAICIRGMSLDETTALTEQMLYSGQRLTWSDDIPKVDKHSTGGLGDKVSLVLAPLLACCGLRVPMISGRGLGITGGTLDKLESIEGFRSTLSIDEIQRQAETIGCVICGATPDLAPADRKLYVLRDVTATIESIPLITASILSKKLAESLDSLVLDVKFGSGAFMADATAARQLAQSLVWVSERLGVQTTALLSNMNQPLGQMVGNALEVKEAMRALAGEGPGDLWALVVALATELLCSRQRAINEAEAARILQDQIGSGAAHEKFAEMIAAQGGNLSTELPSAPALTLCARNAGWLTHVDGKRLGQVMIQLGGGRRVISDHVDPAVGLEFLVKVGERVEKNQPVARIYATPARAEAVSPIVLDALTIADAEVTALPLIAERVTISSRKARP